MTKGTNKTNPIPNDPTPKNSIKNSTIKNNTIKNGTGEKIVPPKSRLNHLFTRFAQKASDALGSVWSFVIAIAVVVIWALTGPLFRYSDAWQLVINTGTTIVTFLMVFLIQNTQNRESKAVHLKLDELIRAVAHARNSMVDLEHMTDEELNELQKEFKRLGERAQRTHDRVNRHLDQQEGKPAPHSD